MAKDIRVTFGQLLSLLRKVGYTTDEIYTPPAPTKPVRVCVDPEDEKHLFLFRERPLNEPVREFELLTTRMHLEYWGDLAPEDFDQFVAEAGSPPKAGKRAKK